MCDATPSYGTWPRTLGHDRRSYTMLHVCHESFTCDISHLCVCHDSVTCVQWLNHVRAMTHSYVCHDSFICDMTHLYLPRFVYNWHDSCIINHLYCLVLFIIMICYYFLSSFIIIICQVTWRIYLWQRCNFSTDSYVTEPMYVCYDSLICAMTH